MSARFEKLLSVGISHTYYAAGCPDFRFLVPADTARLMRNGRLLAREMGSGLHLLCECDVAGDAVVPLVGATLRFGLQLLSPGFGNYTVTPADFPTRRLLYTNDADPAVLAPAGTVAFVGGTFTHVVTDSARPATLTLRDAGGGVVAAETLDEHDPRLSVAFDVRGESAGRLTLEEAFPEGTSTFTYYLDAELQHNLAVGVVEIRIDESFYDTPPGFQIAFEAREDVLRYYVVVKNYTGTDFDHLGVSDAGAADEGRAPIAFERVASGDIPKAEFDTDLVTANGEQVVLFRSTEPLKRREQGYRRIQLSRNGDVLIANLPQPGADRAKADMIVHLLKP